MPLLDSFKADHTRMRVPATYVAKAMTTPGGDTITVFDPHFCVPNKEILSEKGTHALEHLFAGSVRDHLNGNGAEIIGISPISYRISFYMSLINTPGEQRVADVWPASIQDVANIEDQSKILELNGYQCGTYLIHSPAETREIAQSVLVRKVVVNKNEDLTLDDDFLEEQFPFPDEDEIKAI